MIPNRNSNSRSASQVRWALGIVCGCLAAAALGITVVGILLYAFLHQMTHNKTEAGVLLSMPYFAVSPKSEELIFCGVGSGGMDLYSFDLRTHAAKPIHTSREIEWDPSYSRDGGEVLFAQSETPESACSIIRLTLGNGETQMLSRDHTVSDRMPSYSPDGRRIVFARASRQRAYAFGGTIWDTWNVYTMRRDGGDVRQITNSNYYQMQFPHYSPDGKNIVFSATPFGTNSPSAGIYVSPADGKTQPTYVCAGYDVVYSPDGKSILVLQDVTGNQQYDLVLANPDGSQAKPLGVQHRSGYNQFPRFSPDGKRVFFLADPHVVSHPHYALWSVDVKTGKIAVEASPDLFDHPERFEHGAASH